MKREINRRRNVQSMRDNMRAWSKYEGRNKQRIRKVYVPERQMDRYYIKWAFEKQPAAFCNGLQGRYW